MSLNLLLNKNGLGINLRSVSAEVLEAWEQLVTDLNAYNPYALYIAFPDDDPGTLVDRSENGRDSTQATVGDQPLVDYRLAGGRPSYAFYSSDEYDGNSDLLTLPAGANTVYVFGRSRVSAGSAFQVPIRGRVGSNSRWFIENSNDTNNVNFGNNTSFSPISLAQDPAADLQILVMKFDGSTGLYGRKITQTQDGNVTGTGVAVTCDSLVLGINDMDISGWALFNEDHDTTTENAFVDRLKQYQFTTVENAVATSTPFATNGAAVPTWTQSYPAALYDSTSGNTFMTYVSSPDTVNMEVTVQEYDHSTGNFGTALDVHGYTYAYANYHGVPCINVDPDGYIHVIGGSHNNSPSYAISTNPRDISAFQTPVTLSGTYTYPKLVFDDTKGYFFARNLNGSDYNLELRVTTALGSGSVTWGAGREIVTFGASTRVYAGNYAQDDDYIYIPMSRADSGDTFRKDVFLILYDKANDEIRNLEGTRTIAPASWPIGLADMEADFRVIDMGSEEAGNAPYVQLINGNPHIVYVQGGTVNFEDVFDVNHVEWDGSAWSTPVRIGQGYDRFTPCTLSTKENGDLIVYWPQDRNYTGEDSVLKSVRSGGKWSREDVVLDPDTISLVGQSMVVDGRDDFNVFTAEGATGSVNGTYEIFAYGDGSIVT